MVLVVRRMGERRPMARARRRRSPPEHARCVRVADSDEDAELLLFSTRNPNADTERAENFWPDD